MKKDDRHSKMIASVQKDMKFMFTSAPDTARLVQKAIRKFNKEVQRPRLRRVNS